MKKKIKMYEFIDGNCEVVQDKKKFVEDWLETGGSPCSICNDNKNECPYYKSLIEIGAIDDKGR